MIKPSTKIEISTSYMRVESNSVEVILMALQSFGVADEDINGFLERYKVFVLNPTALSSEFCEGNGARGLVSIKLTREKEEE